MPSKILTARTLSRWVRRMKSLGKRIVFTNGTFDILHLGHVTYLQKARALGDILIVGVNTDNSVKTYKDPNRPVNPEQDRIKVLTALACVDYAVLFDESTPFQLIQKIRPNVLVKGSDWALKNIVGAREVKSWGGKVKRIPMVPGRSTTRVIELLQSA